MQRKVRQETTGVLHHKYPRTSKLEDVVFFLALSYLITGVILTHSITPWKSESFVHGGDVIADGIRGIAGGNANEGSIK